MKKTLKNSLYESIMNNVARAVKDAINEDITWKKCYSISSKGNKFDRYFQDICCPLINDMDSTELEFKPNAARYLAHISNYTWNKFINDEDVQQIIDEAERAEVIDDPDDELECVKAYCEWYKGYAISDMEIDEYKDRRFDWIHYYNSRRWYEGQEQCSGDSKLNYGCPNC